MAAAAAGREPERRVELGRCGVRVGDRDDQVVDADKHRPTCDTVRDPCEATAGPIR